MTEKVYVDLYEVYEASFESYKSGDIEEHFTLEFVESDSGQNKLVFNGDNKSSSHAGYIHPYDIVKEKYNDFHPRGDNSYESFRSEVELVDTIEIDGTTYEVRHR